MQYQNGDAAVGFQFVAGGVEALPRNVRPFHQGESVHAPGEQQIVHDLLALGVDFRIDPVNERSVGFRKVDANIVRCRNRPHGLTAERAGPPPDAQVVAERERVVGLSKTTSGGFPSSTSSDTGASSYPRSSAAARSASNRDSGFSFAAARHPAAAKACRTASSVPNSSTLVMSEGCAGRCAIVRNGSWASIFSSAARSPNGLSPGDTAAGLPGAGVSGSVRRSVISTPGE